MNDYVIDYLEFWATRHCNLNCAGCSSCAPIKSPWFLEPQNLRKDFKRLRELGIVVNNVGVLGGEPLLHPKITEIFFVLKEIYPEVNIILLTNGLLLTRMEENFWRDCQKFAVTFRVTLFPVMPSPMRTEIELKLRQYNLAFHLTDKKFFNKILVLNNKDSFEEIVKNCGCNKAYNLFEGNLARCPIPMVMQDLNNYFAVNFLTGGKLNIYSVENAAEIMEFLARPNGSCRNCSATTQKVKWKKIDGVPRLSDWLINNGGSGDL